MYSYYHLGSSLEQTDEPHINHRQRQALEMDKIRLEPPQSLHEACHVKDILDSPYWLAEPAEPLPLFQQLVRATIKVYLRLIASAVIEGSVWVIATKEENVAPLSHQPVAEAMISHSYGKGVVDHGHLHIR